MHLAKHILSSFLALIYPPLCLHCELALNRQKIFCSNCLSTIDPIPVQDRCVHCFTQLESKHQKICILCRHKRHFTFRTAAVFDQIGPITSLLQTLKKQQPHLVKVIAAWMVVQWTQIEWEVPDIIIPAPLPLKQKIRQGYDHIALIAKAFGRYIKAPNTRCLKRCGDPPNIKMKNGHHRLLHDKIILLITDTIGNNNVVEQCAKDLTQAHPRKIYALSFLHRSS